MKRIFQQAQIGMLHMDILTLQQLVKFYLKLRQVDKFIHIQYHLKLLAEQNIFPIRLLEMLLEEQL